MTGSSSRLRRLPGPAITLVLAGVLAACGDAQSTGFKVGHLADCATVGPVQTVTDPADDAHPAPGSDGRSDLVRASLARGRGGLCAELRTADPIGPTTLYAITLRPRRADRPVIAVQVGILAGTSPEIDLRRDTDPALRDAAGAIGIDGSRMTIRVDRAPLQRAGALAMLRDARWEARTVVSGASGTAPSDCAPRCR